MSMMSNTTEYVEYEHESCEKGLWKYINLIMCYPRPPFASVDLIKKVQKKNLYALT